MVIFLFFKLMSLEMDWVEMCEQLGGVWKVPVSHGNYISPTGKSKRELHLNVPVFPDIYTCVPPSSPCSPITIRLLSAFSDQYTQGYGVADKLENNTCDGSPIGCSLSLCALQPIKANEK